MGLVKTSYGKGAMFFHWLSAVLVILAFASGLEGRPSQIYDPANLFDRQLHETLGIAVLALTVLRVVWKLIDRPPEAIAMPAWMHKSAKALQGVLYLLLLLVPLTAMVGAALMGYDIALLGGSVIAPTLPLMESLGQTITEIHPVLGDAILWLAGLHAGASLFHHYILKDGVLVSMLPAWVSAKLPGGIPGQ